MLAWSWWHLHPGQMGNGVTRVASTISRTEQILYQRLMWFIAFMMLTTLDWIAGKMHIQTWLLSMEFSRLKHTWMGKGWLSEFNLTWEQTFGWIVPFLLLFPSSSDIVAQVSQFPRGCWLWGKWETKCLGRFRFSFSG